MEKFIKISLVGRGWRQKTPSKQTDHTAFAKVIAHAIRQSAPFDGDPVKYRKVRISVCHQVDNIHFVEDDKHILVQI